MYRNTAVMEWHHKPGGLPHAPEPYELNMLAEQMAAARAQSTMTGVLKHKSFAVGKLQQAVAGGKLFTPAKLPDRCPE